MTTFSTIDKGSTDASEIALLTLSTGKSQMLLRGGSHARYVTTGHLVFMDAGALQAVPFARKRLEVGGEPIPLLQNVMVKVSGAGNFAVSEDGTLVGRGGPRANAGVDGSQRKRGAFGIRTARLHPRSTLARWLPRGDPHPRRERRYLAL